MRLLARTEQWKCWDRRLPNKDGRRTRWRQVLRGDGYYCLTEAAGKKSQETGIKTIVDLLSVAEFEERPSPFQSSDLVRYINQPLFDADDAFITEDGLSRYEAYRLLIDGHREVHVEHVRSACYSV